MIRRQLPRRPCRHSDRIALAVVSVFCLGLAIMGLGALVFLERPIHLFRFPFLIPWILLVFVIICIPAAYLIANGSFQLFHPLVYPVWSYFFPAFVIGALYFAAGLHDVWYMVLIRDPEYYLPLTLIYIGLGFAGLALGFAMPLGRSIGGAIAHRLPTRDWETPDSLLPALLLVIAGELSKLGAFASGNLGYQVTEEIPTYGAALSMFGFLSTLGSFLLWFAIFRAKALTLRHYLTALLLLGLVAYSMVLGGGKGGLFSNSILLLGAYVLSGRHIRPRQALLLGSLIAGALFVGMAYGTVFRQIKTTEEQLGLQQYLRLGSEAFDRLASQGITENWIVGSNALLQRMDVLSQVSVFVSNHEELYSAEASFGIADIWTTIWAGFVPRAIVPSKPHVSGARGLALLYFSYGSSSPALTPMIDLFRNFGPIGVPIGMALLGLLLNITHSTFIREQKVSAWRAGCYYLILSNVSYESSYGNILPVLIRISFVLLVATVFLRWTATSRGARSLARDRDGLRALSPDATHQ